MATVLHTVSLHLCDMKTLLVPTDFSASAEHATLYAAELAKIIDATVLLLHVYQLPLTMSDFPVMVVSADELKKNADIGLERAKDAAQMAAPGVRFVTESRMGDVVQEINEACDKNEVTAIVTGTKDLSGFERFLVGSTTFSLVKNCSLPLVAVPEAAVITKPSKIALALDLEHLDEVPVEQITNLVTLLGAELQIVHIEGDGRKLEAADLPESLQGIACHSLKEDDVTKGLQHFTNQHNIDALMVLPHKHNFYERLFFKGHTRELINAMPVPVMCIR